MNQAITDRAEELYPLKPIIGLKVFHKDVYDYNEKMEIVGITENKLWLEGDYSGGTHNVCQRGWHSLSGAMTVSARMYIQVATEWYAKGKKVDWKPISQIMPDEEIVYHVGKIGISGLAYRDFGIWVNAKTGRYLNFTPTHYAEIILPNPPKQ